MLRDGGASGRCRASQTAMARASVPPPSATKHGFLDRVLLPHARRPCPARPSDESESFACDPDSLGGGPHLSSPPSCWPAPASPQTPPPSPPPRRGTTRSPRPPPRPSST